MRNMNEGNELECYRRQDAAHEPCRSRRACARRQVGVFERVDDAIVCAARSDCWRRPPATQTDQEFCSMSPACVQRNHQWFSYATYLRQYKKPRTQTTRAPVQQQMRDNAIKTMVVNRSGGVGGGWWWWGGNGGEAVENVRQGSAAKAMNSTIALFMLHHRHARHHHAPAIYALEEKSGGSMSALNHIDIWKTIVRHET